jgi:DNA mismatch repair protein MutH
MKLNDALIVITNKIINKQIYLPKTVNKGNAGHFLEKELGLKLNNNHLDFIDGELKTFPLKKLKNGTFSPKETIAITMMKSTENNSFNESNLFSKIKNILFVPYHRINEDYIIFYKPVHLNYLKNKNEYQLIEIDYKLIQTQELTSKVGKYIQTRTKGSKNSKTRAYYFKTKFIKEFILQHGEFILV